MAVKDQAGGWKIVPRVQSFTQLWVPLHTVVGSTTGGSWEKGGALSRIWINLLWLLTTQVPEILGTLKEGKECLLGAKGETRDHGASPAGGQGNVGSCHP